MQKETYFTTETILSKAKEMLISVSDLRRNHANIDFHPSRAALLVLDMQNYFLEPSSHAFIPSASAILPGIQSLIKVFYARRLPVFFSRHLNTPEDAGMMVSWWRDLILPEGKGSEIISTLDVTESNVLRKTQYDAFYQTSLESDLRGRGVGELVITGVMTHLCCETTTRSAFMRGFDVFFTINGTATYTEAFHCATLLNLAHGFAVPALVEDILAVFENGKI